MSEVVVAKPRVGKFNKNAARRVRVAGKIPAVLYGPGSEPVAIEVDPKQISKILFSETGHNTIFDVEVAGQSVAKAMIVDWQREPLNDKLIHIDLKRIALDKTLRVKRARQAAGHSGGREELRRHSGSGSARSGDRVPAGRHSQPHRRGCQPSGAARRVARRGLPHSEKIKYINNEDATVAHVVTIREEAPTAAETEAAQRRSSSCCGSSRAGSCQEGQAGRRGQSCRCGRQEARGEEVSLGRGS